MLINELCKIYGVDRRDVDYWTRCGFIHPHIMDNGYRDYGKQAEEELKLVIVASMLDYPGSLKSKLDMLRDLDTEQWQSVLEKLKNRNAYHKHLYNVAYNTATSKVEGR